MTQFTILTILFTLTSIASAESIVMEGQRSNLDKIGTVTIIEGNESCVVSRLSISLKKTKKGFIFSSSKSVGMTRIDKGMTRHRELTDRILNSQSSLESEFGQIYNQVDLIQAMNSKDSVIANDAKTLVDDVKAACDRMKKML